MASPHLYVRDDDGSDADNGTTWALAKATVAGAAAIDSTTDYQINVADTHNESSGSNITWAWAGTVARPTLVLAVDDAAEPPTALAGARIPIETTGNQAITVTGNCYVRGFAFHTSTTPGSNVSAQVTLTPTTDGFQTYENCSAFHSSTNANAHILLGSAGTLTSSLRLIDFDVRVGATAQSCVIRGDVRWTGGEWASGGSTPTDFFEFAGNRGCDFLIENFDFSPGGGSSTDIFIGGSVASGSSVGATVINCKLPGSWSGDLWSATPANPFCRARMHNCSSGDVNYALYEADGLGSVRDETTIVRSGARTDGTTNVSWRVVTLANAEFPMLPFILPRIYVWKEAGTYTIKIPFVHDDATDAKTNEIGMDIYYAGTSGSPLYLLATTDEHLLTSSFAVHSDATSADNWGSTGFSNENEQRMSLSVTLNEAGNILIIPKVYEASKTVYIDPDPQIS